MAGPRFGTGSQAGQCGYAARAADELPQVIIAPLVSMGGQPWSVHQQHHADLALYREGTAKDRRTQRIIDEPSLGAGGYINAFILNGVPGAPVEQVDGYAGHWHVTLDVHTSDLLAAGEVRDIARLMAALH